jgi:hypothetical protein
MTRHKKTKKIRRRRSRGGSWMRPDWLFGPEKPVMPGELPETVAAKAAAPVVNSTVGTPSQQAAAIGVTPAPPSASAGLLGAGRRRRSRGRRTRRY